MIGGVGFLCCNQVSVQSVAYEGVTYSDADKSLEQGQPVDTRDGRRTYLCHGAGPRCVLPSQLVVLRRG